MDDLATGLSQPMQNTLRYLDQNGTGKLSQSMAKSAQGLMRRGLVTRFQNEGGQGIYGLTPDGIAAAGELFAQRMNEYELQTQRGH